MATRQFADLSSYRRAVSNAQGTANLLDTILGGVQQGIQLQRLPQTLQEQDLARQLNNALVQEKLFNLQNPQQALANQIEKELTLKAALNPDLGLLTAQRGLGTIATPGAITVQQQAALPSQEVMDLRNAALAQGGVSIPTALPTAAPGLPITEVAPFGIGTGVYSDPSVPLAAAQRKQDADLNQLREELTLKNQFATTSQTRNLQFRDVGNAIVSLDPATGREVSRIEKDINERLINTANGPFVYDPKNPQGGRYISTPTAGTRGGLKPTGEQTKAFGSTINVFTTLDDIEKKALELQKSGKFPGSGQVFISQALSQKATDIPGAGLIPGASGVYAAIQQKLRSAQTPESRQYEAMRAELTANIIRAQAGLSQTSGEVENVIPYTPQTSDTIESLLDKLNNLKRIASRDINTSRLLFPDFREIQIPGFTAQQPQLDIPPALNGQIRPQSNQLASPENYPNEEAARSAGFGNGDIVIIRGQTGVLE